MLFRSVSQSRYKAEESEKTEENKTTEVIDPDNLFDEKPESVGSEDNTNH